MDNPETLTIVGIQRQEKHNTIQKTKKMSNTDPTKKKRQKQKQTNKKQKNRKQNNEVNPFFERQNLSHLQ